MFRWLFTIASTAVMHAAVPAWAQQPGAAANQKGQAGTRWENDSMRFGDAVRIEPKVRLQRDVLLWNDPGPIEDRYSWGSRRLGVNGELFDRVQFQVERAFQEDSDEDTEWRDVFVDVRISRALQVRGGRFKLPFSLERNTSRDDLDFVQRPGAVRALAPSRDTGLMLHGRVANRLVAYEVGIFRHADGFDLADDPSSRSGLGATLAGRVAVSPIRDRSDGPTRDLEFGVALVRNTVPGGLNSVVGRTVDGERFFERFEVNGQRTRLGAEGLWRGRRATLKGELLQLADQRTGQAVTGEDLSDLLLRGAYITCVVRVFGKSGKRGPAVDAAVRFDRLSIGSRSSTDEAFTNPRADRVAPLAKHTWTFGGTWRIHRSARVQGNLLRELFVDSLGVRESVPEPSWTVVVRFQFAL